MQNDLNDKQTAIDLNSTNFQNLVSVTNVQANSIATINSTLADMSNELDS